VRVAVIGAGPAGLAAAYRLVGAGADVDLFEAGSEVGGLARSLKLWNQTVDVGPHRFFSTDPRVNGFWLEIVGDRYRMVDRRTRIYSDGRFFHYPLRAGDALRNLGPTEAVRCLASYCRQIGRRAPNTSGDFEQWMIRRFGSRLFERFFRSYSERLWGLPCAQLDADFAAQRIRGLSLGEAVLDALSLAVERHRTLVDRFAYPLGGTGSVYAELAHRIVKAGGRVHLRRPVSRISVSAGSVDGVVDASGVHDAVDHVVSTMPLTHLVAGLDDLPSAVQQANRALRYRNTVLVYLRVEASELFDDQWIYVHDPALVVGRLTNFRNWVPELYGEESDSILALEYWCSDGDPLWSEPAVDSIARATRELAATGLLGETRIAAGHVIRIRRAYPIYELGYREHLGVIARHLSGIDGLSVIGRYGSFKYNNQDHSLLMGLLAAENLTAGRRHDLWSINSDREYQEAAVITESGLEPAPAAAGAA
jgi:protoporphyrinogen oxidase